ncbi:OmpA family protein [Prevotella sp. E13-17]|uniref:OmpA family protein n=1 Tax=Prevotella sp. E13-17 TaxID=2913616 RepID=UPI001EDB0253|nr:OmpA family protein [Prevotella sp. E13-17]UKK50491.1 OmpA family protein [Prevotella sp. E13-17]
MKKYLMMLAFASVSVAGMAQSETPTQKYSVATNSFWSNWFVSADVAYSAFYSNEEKGADFAKSPLKDFRRNLGASLAIGKWFTPGMGLRTKFSGIWGRNVQTENASDNAVKYWNLQEQALFNLSNMLCGYSETRVWNFIPYAGYGVVRNMSDNYYADNVSVGLLNTWKLSKKLFINLDVNFNYAPDYDAFRFNRQATAHYGDHMPNCDRYFSAEVGLTYNLGKATWNKTPDVDALKALHQSELDALNARLSDANAENDRLNDIIKNHKCPEAKTVTVKEVAVAPVSVFFNLNKSKIASKKDLVNVKNLAEIAKANDKTIVVTGYADSQTGRAAYNQKLSEKRANTVKAELIKMGVDESKIEVVAKGGVKILKPASFDRRATVEIK